MKKLKVAAAQNDMSLRDYVLMQLGAEMVVKPLVQVVTHESPEYVPPAGIPKWDSPEAMGTEPRRAERGGFDPDNSPKLAGEPAKRLDSAEMPAVPKPKSSKKRKCPHGRDEGDICFQCGGMAKAV
jgi:hypothetical protein